MSFKQLTIWSLLILLSAGILRFSNLNSLPIFADEAIYVRWSQVMRAEPSLRFLPLSDGKQPFFMWVTIPFFKIISDPLIAGRVLSALAGLGMVLGVGLATYLLFSSVRQALIASVLAATIPYLVFFNRMALVDSLLALFLLWSFIFSYLSFKHSRLDLAMIAGFFLGFAWLTKSPAIFAFVLLPLNFLFIPKVTSKTLISCIIYLTSTFIIALGMYNILRLGSQFHMIAQRNLDYVLPLSNVLRRPLDPLLPHLKDSLQFYFYLTTPLGLIFILWGVFAGRLSHLQNRIVLALWWLIPIVAQSAFAKAFTARYLLFTVPFAIILMSLAFEHIGRYTRGHFLTLASVGLIILPSLWIDSLFLYHPNQSPLPRIERSGYLEEWTAGFGLREVSQKLREYAISGPVLVGSEGYFGTPIDALQLYLNDVPNVRVIGIGIWIDHVDQKLVSALGDNQVFLVVNSTRFHGDPDKFKPHLKLLASYPKGIRPNGTQEYLLFFKVEKP